MSNSIYFQECVLSVSLSSSLPRSKRCKQAKWRNRHGSLNFDDFMHFQLLMPPTGKSQNKHFNSVFIFISRERKTSACDQSVISLSISENLGKKSIIPTGKFPNLFLAKLCNARFSIVYEKNRKQCGRNFVNLQWARDCQLQQRVNVSAALESFKLNVLSCFERASLFEVPHYNILSHSFSVFSQSSSFVSKRWGNEMRFQNREHY